MDWLIWSGAIVSLLGLGGLVWCILTVTKGRRAQFDDEAMRKVLARVMPMNMAALFLSVIGLMMVVIGILIG